MTRPVPILTRLRRAWRAGFAASYPVEPDFPFPASAGERERPAYDREEVLRQALLAWQSNPLARRIVELTTHYVTGGGLRLRAGHPGAQRYLDDWWRHPLNQVDVRSAEWCDELTRAGELFFLVSTDPAGMSYLRAVPALQVAAVHTRERDLQQETGYSLRPAPGSGELEGERYPAYDPRGDDPGPDGRFPAVMLHYAVNRPVGAVRGESDLAPLLKWLNRYAAWLEDRARLNRYRTAFLYVVRTRFASPAERAARQNTLQASPPTPGSILVTDESESWETLSPRLEADDAASDGLALKKMIAAGAGLPLHFLAEPESETRTTAEAAGGPTFRRFEQRQQFFLWMLADLARLALRRRAACDPTVGDPEETALRCYGGDLTARDNLSLAQAAEYAGRALLPLHERGLLPANELARLVYRFAGETAGLEDAQ